MHTIDDAQAVGHLLAQALERLDRLSEVAALDDTTWWVGFDDGQGLQVEWSPRWRRVVFTAGLGPPPSGEEAAALNLALAYNALWREVGHLRIARPDAQGELLLIGDFPPGHGDPETFNAALLHVGSLQTWWTAAIAGAMGAAPPPGPAPDWLRERI